MILLVEDDHLVRELLQSFLESAGYRVIEAKSAEDALRLVAADSSNPQLLITDMDLPGLDGRELASRLKERWPDIAVLYMSGNPVEDKTVGERGTASITKPFSREALMARVRDLLT